jgi:hypothetical protein
MNISNTLRLAAFTLIAAANTGWAQTGLSGVASTFDVGKGFSATVERAYYTSRHSALEQYNGSEVTSLTMHRKFNPGTFHYGNTYAPAERHQHFGFSTDRITAAYFQGSGASFSKAGSGVYKDLNHYFFHGGNRAPFQFQGGGLDVDIGSGLSAQVAGIRVKSSGLEDRSGQFAGISAGRFSGGLFGLDRGGKGVGHGFNFAFTGVRAGFEYQEVRSDSGAHLRRLGVSWRGNTATRFSLDLEDASNPLYASADERRVMFRFQRSFGPGVSFSATEQEGEASEEAGDKGKYTNVVAIGLGVGALAAVVSSGDSGSDESQRFATSDEAAFDVMNRINPVSVQQNREHGGWIYRQADGSFNSTNPVAGGVASVNIGNPATAVPTGTTASASYHTHGGPDPRYDNENFSPQDILSDVLAGVDGYLGTPAGLLKKHVLVTNQVIILGMIAN